MLSLVAPLIQGFFGLIDKAIPDTAEAARLKTEIQRLIIEGQGKEMEEAVKVVMSEAQGESWLQRNWRPLTMLTFVGLVVAKWLGYTVSGVTESVELALMDLIQIGLGGYVVGRSLEKIAPSIADALKK
jgi:hypothetical protein